MPQHGTLIQKTHNWKPNSLWFTKWPQVSLKLATSGSIDYVSALVCAEPLSELRMIHFPEANMPKFDMLKTLRLFQASDSEIIWVMRIAGVVFGAISVISAIKVNTIYGLLVLSSDLVYVILFPQVVAIFYLPFANSYGSLCGIIMGLFFRITGGEPLLGIPGVICYPYCYEVDGVMNKNFPVKILSMSISLMSIITGSYMTYILFRKRKVPLRYDIFRCFQSFEAQEEEMTKL